MQIAVGALAILASGVMVSAPAQAAPKVPAGYQMLPGWELPARLTVQADGSILAEAEPAAVKAMATAAAAASGCGSACDGGNPNTYSYGGSTCGTDGETVKAVYEPGGNFYGAELRYSPHCRTAWTRRAAGTPSETTDIWVYSYNASGSARINYLVDDGTTNFTRMVNDAGLTAKACYGYEDFSYPPPFPYTKICTTAY